MKGSGSSFWEGKIWGWNMSSHKEPDTGRRWMEEIQAEETVDEHVWETQKSVWLEYRG